MIVNGPAVIRSYLPVEGVGTAFLTFEIKPERIDPNQAQFIAPADGDVQVKMECSTDLLNWQSATNGVYASPTGAKFFRLRLDKVP